MQFSYKNENSHDSQQELKNTDDSMTGEYGSECGMVLATSQIVGVE